MRMRLVVILAVVWVILILVSIGPASRVEKYDPTTLAARTPIKFESQPHSLVEQKKGGTIANDPPSAGVESHQQGSEAIVKSIPSQSPPKKVRPPTLIVDKAREDNYFAYWPKSDDAALNALKERVNIIYTEADLPRYHQLTDIGPPGGIVSREAAANARELTANLEFPWRNPAGVPNNSNTKQIRFAAMHTPMEWWFDGTRIDWRYVSELFSPDITFGEILLVTAPDGTDHTWALRTREFRPDGSVSANEYRPFPSEKLLADALKKRGYDRNFNEDKATQLILDSRLSPTNHVRNAFIAEGISRPAPLLPSSVVSDLLDNEEFHSVKKYTNPYTPTSAEYNIVPIGYNGGAIKVTNNFCMNCHQDAGKVVNLNSPQRRWRLSGNGGIFTFHPFAPNDPSRFNDALANAGLLLQRIPE